MKDTAPYGGRNIRRNLVYFFFGKGLSSIAGIGYFLLVVRNLPTGEFAIYSILLAFAEIFAAVTGFGFLQVLARFVPELNVQRKHGALAALVGSSLASRSLIILAACGLLLTFEAQIANWFLLEGVEQVLSLYLLVLGLRSTAESCIQVLESLLMQGLSQLAATLTTVLKVSQVVFICFVSIEALTLDDLIRLEIIAEAVGVAMLLIFGSSVLVRKRTLAAAAGDSGWIKRNLARMARFGSAGYFQHLAILFYGGAANRIVVGRLFDPSIVAGFGFAQSSIDYIARYLPGRLLQGMIRPVLLARFAVDRDLRALSYAINLVFKIDYVILGAGIVVLALSGDVLSALVSKGKYADVGGNLILALLIVLVFESLIALLWISLEALERNRVLLITNALLSASILLAFPLASLFGVFAVAVANLVGIIASICTVLAYLTYFQLGIRLNWLEYLRLSFVVLACIAVGKGILFLDGVWWVATVAAATLYGILVLLGSIFSRQELTLLLRLRGGD